MRVFLGLAALAASAASVNALDLVGSGAPSGASSTFPPPGQTAQSKIAVRVGGPSGALPTSILPSSFNENSELVSGNWQIEVPSAVTAINFRLNTNIYTAQLQWRFGGTDYATKIAAFNQVGSTLTTANYFCDVCTGGTLPSPRQCNTSTGPGPAPGPIGTSPVAGFPCASLQRDYLFTGLVPRPNAQSTLINSIAFLLFDRQTDPGANTSSYSFTVGRATTLITGDPQIVGMQGQDFQVHGMPDEIFNIVSYPNVQINARFTYLESAGCHDNFTACFAHPGTYISEEGIRVGKDKIRVQAGSHKKGLTVTVNGKKAHKNVDLKHGAVEMVSHRRVVVHTDVMKISISNSDNFMNQELELADDKLTALGANRIVLKDNERFHPEVPLHGLQGQTWRNVEYASGLEYEGSIMDYHVVDGNLFGTDFVFNQFQS